MRYLLLLLLRNRDKHIQSFELKHKKMVPAWQRTQTAANPMTAASRWLLEHCSPRCHCGFHGQGGKGQKWTPKDHSEGAASWARLAPESCHHATFSFTEVSHRHRRGFALLLPISRAEAVQSGDQVTSSAGTQPQHGGCPRDTFCRNDHLLKWFVLRADELSLFPWALEMSSSLSQ